VRARLITILLAPIALVTLAACGNDEPPPPPPPPPGVTPPTNPIPPNIPGQPIPGQPVIPGQPPVPGQPPQPVSAVTLTPGFTPDPHVVMGTSGGTVSATGLHADCRGWVAANPNHLFTAAGSFTSLRLLVNGGSEDTTLVVQRPDGTYVCNDDAEGHHPIIANVTFPPGIYKVWVGSYAQGVSANYNLGFTELSSVNVARVGMPAGTLAPPPPSDLSSNYGNITLSSGFMPDPHRATGTAGGAVQAEAWDGACRGAVSQTPDHLFIASDNFTFLKILVSSQSDTTLIVQKPDGTFLCNDDDDGLNPGITGTFPPGTYRIWVGSYNESERPQYTLGLSELSSTSASEL